MSSPYEIKYNQELDIYCHYCAESINLKEISVVAKRKLKDCVKNLHNHLECFIEKMKDTKKFVQLETLPGFEFLTRSDQLSVKEKSVEVMKMKPPKKEPKKANKASNPPPKTEHGETVLHSKEDRRCNYDLIMSDKRSRTERSMYRFE